MSDAGSAAYLTILTGAHEFGVRRPRGGSGQLTRALAACVVDHGGQIRVGAHVTSIAVKNGRAVGVILRDGEEVAARVVVAATDPVVLATQLLEQGVLPQSTHDQIRGLKTTINPINVFKADIALSRMPKFSGLGHGNIDRDLVSALSLCPSMEAFHRSERACSRGEYEDDNIPMTNYIPSIVDRSLVPESSGGDYLYLYASNAPQELSGGRTWETEAPVFLKKCLSIFDRYAPGTSESVLDAYITPPTEFARRYNGNNGNYAQVGMGSPNQLGPWRPIPDFSGNKTPVDGLWHASSGSHPIPYINGWAGRTVAREILRSAGRP
jgi:beta-carotene ketolase (CrtO type)